MHRGIRSLLAIVFLTPACSSNGQGPAQDDYWEGVAYDEEHPGANVAAGKEDSLSHVYDVPTDLPELEAPEIIVSLEQLTLHLFDRRTGFSKVYPVGVGVLNSDGVSVTPTGHFATGPDVSDRWWYIPRRSVPSYFGGWPFLRLTAENSRGQNTYGIHGPITEHLIRGYVSHGCIRMEGPDVVEVYYLVNTHPSTPVTIQREPELDAAGHVVDVGSHVTLWGPDDEIQYGASVGEPPPRDETGTDEEGCADDRLESPDPVPLEPGTYRGLVICPSDSDLYQVQVPAGRTLTARITFDGQIADLDLLLTNSDDVVVDRSAGVSDEETVHVTSESDAPFTITVYPYQPGLATTYDLQVTVE